MLDVVDEPTRAPVAEVPSVVDALISPDDTAAFLAMMTPSSDVGLPLAVLDPAELSPAGRVDMLTTLERQIRWLTARQQQVLAAMLDGAPSGAIWDADGDRFLPDEIACALAVAGVTARAKLAIAADLTGRLSATLAMVEAGELPYWHAKILSDALAGFDDAFAAAVQARILPRAVGKTASEFRDAVRRVIHRLDTRDVEKRHRAASEARHVTQAPDEDGVAEIHALLPADGAATVMAAIHAWSGKSGSDDHRSADQRRADALVEICHTALHDPLVPRVHGSKPAVQVTIAATTLAGLNDEPGELAGYGPIPAAMARRIASDPTGTWRRLVTDDAGQLLDYGRRTYAPPKPLADHVIARDQHCCFPGCRRPAGRCHLDHRVPFPQGPTSEDNLQALCEHHHQLKHRGGWQLTRADEGSYVWHSPTRHRYRYRPPGYPIPESGAASDIAAALDAARHDDDDPPPF